MAKKKHNWVTGPNHPVVDRSTHLLAAEKIGHCNHLTPATEAEIDNLLIEHAARNHPEVVSDADVNEPDPEVVAAMMAPEDEPLAWMDEVEPSPEELQAIAAEEE